MGCRAAGATRRQLHPVAIGIFGALSAMPKTATSLGSLERLHGRRVRVLSRVLVLLVASAG